jgi:serine/threonine-protein kinase
VSAVGGLLFAGLVGGGFAIQSAAGRFDEDSADFTSGSDALSPARAGYLRVVVDPWADVWIDGQKVATTPIARAIALSPGRHYVKLSNPYHREHQEAVRIRTGETEVVEVELQPLHVLDEGAAP